MLERLIREALFHGHQERRHQASTLLNVSAYRPALAAALVETVEAREPKVGLPATMLLRYLATEAQRDALLDWASDETHPKIRATAILCLGRIPGGLHADDEPLVLKALDGGGRATQRACLYALGMSGSPTLETLRLSTNPGHASAAEWWTRTGPALHESVFRPTA